MSPDRRKPLGGVQKETFVSSADNPHLNAEFTYDLIAGLRSDLCHKIDEIKSGCLYRDTECHKIYVPRLIRKLPLTPMEIMILLGGAGVLVGIGVWGNVKIVKKHLSQL